MIDFNRKPSSKTDEEKEFDELNYKYTEKFGVPYRFSIGIDMPTWTEAIKDIRERIETDNPQSEPDYEPGLNY